MNPDEMAAAMQRLNEGAPLSPVNPSDMQKMWEVSQKYMPDRKAKGAVAVDSRLYAAHGVDPAAFDGEQHVSMSMRQWLLVSLVERGVLRDYFDGEKLRPEVFRAAATIPCDKNDLSEALASHHLPEMSAEEAAKLREQMQAEGFDLEHPKVDEKFLAWMRDRTSDR
jgi:hypothetical protein